MGGKLFGCDRQELVFEMVLIKVGPLEVLSENGFQELAKRDWA